MVLPHWDEATGLAHDTLPGPSAKAMHHCPKPLASLIKCYKVFDRLRPRFSSREGETCRSPVEHDLHLGPLPAAGRGIWLLPRCANRTSDTLSWLPNGAAVTVLDVLHSPEPRAGGIASYHAGWNRQRHRETENRELPEFLTKRYATIKSENDMRLIAGSEKKRRKK